MKFGQIVAATLLIGVTMPSWAIIGLGAHWAPNAGFALKSSKAVLDVNNSSTGITMAQGDVDGAQGFGVKVWLDFLPFIDIEATGNFQLGMYDVTLSHASFANPIEVKSELDFPIFNEAKPFFAQALGDVSILYPFLKLPPVVSLVKLYAGGGLTYGAATPVLNVATSKKIIAKNNVTLTGTTQEEITSNLAKDLAKGLAKDGLESGIGFHLMAGAKLKPPIIPIAIYANAKYYLLSFLPDAVDSEGITFELGGALAF